MGVGLKGEETQREQKKYLEITEKDGSKERQRTGKRDHNKSEDVQKDSASLQTEGRLCLLGRMVRTRIHPVNSLSLCNALMTPLFMCQVTYRGIWPKKKNI